MISEEKDNVIRYDDLEPLNQKDISGEQRVGWKEKGVEGKYDSAIVLVGRSVLGCYDGDQSRTRKRRHENIVPLVVLWHAIDRNSQGVLN